MRIFTKSRFTAKEKTFDWGVLKYISVGEEGRGRHEEKIPVPNGVEYLSNGDYPALTIGLTKSGRPRINFDRGSSKMEYLIVSTEHRYTRRGDGYFRIYNENEHVSVLASGNGADGDAGRIGSWVAAVVQLPKNQTVVFEIRTAGGGYGTPWIYLIHTKENKWFEVEGGDLRDFIDTIDENPDDFNLIECLSALAEKPGSYHEDHEGEE